MSAATSPLNGCGRSRTGTAVTAVAHQLPRHAARTEVDISSQRFWSQPFDTREESFARLRATAPVSWHRQLETPGLAKRYREPGFWAVTRHADVAFVSRRPDLFSSHTGPVTVRPAPFAPQNNMLVLDPPAHTAHRRIVSGAFTARAVEVLSFAIRRQTRQLVLQAIHQQTFDFVSAIATKLPALALSALIGVPASERAQFIAAVDTYTGAGLPASLASGAGVAEYLTDQVGYLRHLILAMAAYRHRNPVDDVMSRLVRGQVDGRCLTSDEVVSTVLLLLVAGHATTKNALSLAVFTLDRHPQQRRWLLDDFDSRFPAAFDEIMRYTSPILAFARTATQPVVLHDRHIAVGQKVAMFYCSANRDEAAFAQPGRLNLKRANQKHLAFGSGAHFCLGRLLARTQTELLLRELYTRTADLTVGEPRFGQSDFLHLVDALPVRATRRRTHLQPDSPGVPR